MLDGMMSFRRRVMHKLLDETMACVGRRVSRLAASTQRRTLGLGSGVQMHTVWLALGAPALAGAVIQHISANIARKERSVTRPRFTIGITLAFVSVLMVRSS